MKKNKTKVTNLNQMLDDQLVAYEQFRNGEITMASAKTIFMGVGTQIRGCNTLISYSRMMGKKDTISRLEGN